MESVPTEKIWKNISPQKNRTRILKNKQSNIWKKLAIAASVLAMVGWGLWFIQEEDPTFNLADISPEMAERELQLQQLISQKEKEINLNEIDETLYGDILSDLKTIDQNTEETKNDISLFPDERAVETLIRNYELKIRILENLNREIEKRKYHEELEKSI